MALRHFLLRLRGHIIWRDIVLIFVVNLRCFVQEGYSCLEGRDVLSSENQRSRGFAPGPTVLKFERNV
eukprot:scaffold160084_cov24-Prasinocladus_malaysianus.AAC.1